MKMKTLSPSDLIHRLNDTTICNGQSNPEYCTAILEMCGIQETWSQVGTPPRWVSSVASTRRRIERLVALIKERTAENVLFHQEAEKAIGRVRHFLEGN